VCYNKGPVVNTGKQKGDKPFFFAVYFPYVLNVKVSLLQEISEEVKPQSQASTGQQSEGCLMCIYKT
jgi:hypothetical protein